MLSPNFKIALIFLWFLIITCANTPGVVSCQGKQSSSSEWVKGVKLGVLLSFQMCTAQNHSAFHLPARLTSAVLTKQGHLLVTIWWWRESLVWGKSWAFCWFLVTTTAAAVSAAATIATATTMMMMIIMIKIVVVVESAAVVVTAVFVAMIATTTIKQ